MHPHHINHRRHAAPVRGLIFDMDGTILDTRPYHMAAWREMVAQLNLPPHCYDLAERGFGKTNWLIFQEWWGPHADTGHWEAISQEKECCFRRLIHGQTFARPGFRELLEWARRQNIRIALATSGPKENPEYLLHELGATLLFHTVVFGHGGIRSKPHPDPFLLAARRLGLPPQQCLGFEDSTHGFWSVQRAGMGLVAIAERKQDLPTCRKWTPWAFEDFRPLPRLIERINQEN